MEGQVNLVEIANEVSRCLISHSSSSLADEKEVFNWRSKVNNGKELFEFAKTEGCFISAKEGEVQSDWGRGNR